MQNIDSYDFSGKKAIVRVDFNVPLDSDFNITDDTRIRAAIPTLKKVLAGGGSLIIMSHLGKPKGPAEKFSLKHIIGRIEELLGTKVQFAPDCMKADEQAAALKPGEVLLLENLRFYAEEEGKPRGLAEDATEEEKKAAKAAVKESQKKFTEHLASYADCYINDAFGTAHRAHASTALIAKYFPNDKMFGYVMEGEIKAIDKVLGNPQRPLTVILGGAKVSSKLGVIEHLLDLADNMIIGGGMVSRQPSTPWPRPRRKASSCISPQRLWLPTPSTTMRTPRSALRTPFPTDGWAWTPHPRLWPSGKRYCSTPRPSSGTAP